MNTVSRVRPDPAAVKRQNALFDLWSDFVAEHGDDPGYDPDDDPRFVEQSRRLMQLPPLSAEPARRRGGKGGKHDSPTRRVAVIQHGATGAKARRRDLHPGVTEFRHWWIPLGEILHDGDRDLPSGSVGVVEKRARSIDHEPNWYTHGWKLTAAGLAAMAAIAEDSTRSEGERRHARTAIQRHEAGSPRVAGRDLMSWATVNAAKLRKIDRDQQRPHGDDVLTRIGAEQGWEVHPPIGTAADLDKAIAGGGVEVWRGVSGNMPGVWGYGPDQGKPIPFDVEESPMARLRRMRTGGPAEYGTGIYGNGYYVSVSRKVADEYGFTPLDTNGQLIVGSADPRSIQRMVILPEAKVIEHEELERLWPQHADRLRKTGIRDLGSLAALLGYDAVKVSGRHDVAHRPQYADQYIILNRTAILFQDHDMEPLP